MLQWPMSTLVSSSLLTTDRVKSDCFPLSPCPLRLETDPLYSAENFFILHTRIFSLFYFYILTYSFISWLLSSSLGFQFSSSLLLRWSRFSFCSLFAVSVFFALILLLFSFSVWLRPHLNHRFHSHSICSVFSPHPHTTPSLFSSLSTPCTRPLLKPYLPSLALATRLYRVLPSILSNCFCQIQRLMHCH